LELQGPVVLHKVCAVVSPRDPLVQILFTILVGVEFVRQIHRTQTNFMDKHFNAIRFHEKYKIVERIMLLVRLEFLMINYLGGGSVIKIWD
jgi:hypothetical protein